MLFRSFIEKPSTSLDARHLKQVTASGPPLAELTLSLQRLRDRRMATPGSDIETAHARLAALKAAID